MLNTAQRKFKAIRKKEQLSQEEFCRITGISIFRLSKIERGKADPRFSELASTVRAFSEVDPEDFFNESFQ